MSKYRTLNRGDVLPASFVAALQEYNSTAANNLAINVATATQIKVPASTGNGQVGLGINGLWRYNSADTIVSHPGGAAGVYDIIAVASANSFTNTPNPDTDNTDYSFGVQILPTGTAATGNYNGNPITAQRVIGRLNWTGSAITWVAELGGENTDGMLFGSAGDTNLYRSAASTLTTDGSLYAGQNLGARAGAASQVRIGDRGVGAAAGISFGSSEDTVLYRSAANALTTAASLSAGGLASSANVTLTGGASQILARAQSGSANTVFATSLTADIAPRFAFTVGGQLSWGSGTTGSDISLYRISAGNMAWDGASLAIGQTLTTGSTSGILTTTAVRIGTVSSNAGIMFGSALDVNIYRSGTLALKTDNDFTVAGNNGLFVNQSVSLTASGAYLARSAGAATIIAYATRKSTDTVDMHNVDASGKHQWGPGGAAAVDTNLYRNGVGVLKTDTTFTANATSIGSLGPSSAAAVQMNDATIYRSNANNARIDGIFTVAGSSLAFPMNLVGTGTSPNVADIRFGDGSGWYMGIAPERGANAGLKFIAFKDNGILEWRIPTSGVVDSPAVNLYRVAANVLQTDGAMRVGTSAGQIQFGNAGTTTATILFGATQDANLYRSAAGILKTDTALYLGTDLTARQGAATQVQVGSNTSAMILFGSAQDANFYRSAAGILKTDTALYVGTDLTARQGATTQVQVGSNTSATILFGSAQDANFYRSAAGILKTDTALYVGTDLTARQGAATQVQVGSNVVGASAAGFALGSALDANLWRDSSHVLKTDSTFRSTADLVCRDNSANFVQVGLNTAGGNVAGVAFGLTSDANIWRVAAASIKTDSAFDSGSELRIRGTSIASSAAYAEQLGVVSTSTVGSWQTITNAGPTVTVTVPTGGRFCFISAECEVSNPSGSGNALMSLNFALGGTNANGYPPGVYTTDRQYDSVGTAGLTIGAGLTGPVATYNTMRIGSGFGAKYDCSGVVGYPSANFVFLTAGTWTIMMIYAITSGGIGPFNWQNRRLRVQVL